MNQDETVALFARCQEARKSALAEGTDGYRAREAARAVWNGWAEAMLAERKSLEDAGEWAAEEEWFSDILEPKNDATRTWMERAKADFSHVQFRTGAQGAQNEPRVGEGEKSNDASAAPINSLLLEGEEADFAEFIFPGDAKFEETRFYGDTDFWGARFFGGVGFGGAQFDGDAGFGDALFVGRAGFTRARFRGDAWFMRARFLGNAEFGAALFGGEVRFDWAEFSGRARFEESRFYVAAGFVETIFGSKAEFGGAQFRGEARFRGAHFSGAAGFGGGQFSGEVGFRGAQFFDAVTFRGQTFAHDVFFNGAVFRDKADFALATFERVAQFDAAQFFGKADFNAVWGKRTFSLADAVFEGVPDFIQAHFEEAPRLDNVQIKGQLVARRASWKLGKKLWRLEKLHRTLQTRSYTYRRITQADPDIPARWRALKRFAVQGHDTDRELQFFSGEMRSARFAFDWPLPWPPWKGSAWGGFFRFWLGIAYQAFSDFGRSIVRPLAVWLAVSALAAFYYLGQTPALIKERESFYAQGHSVARAYGETSWTTLWKERKCYEGEAKLKSDEYIGALSPSLRGSTDAWREAWRLARHNAFIVLDSSGDAAHRMYGCLYGVERYGGSPVAVVPGQVADASTLQKFVSGVMIFLFGLALRNMLKVK